MQIYADVTEPAAVRRRLGPGAGARLGDPRGGRRRRLPGRGRRGRGDGRVRGATRTSRIRTALRAYDELYAEYRRLHDHFGRGGNDVMRRLRAIRNAARAGAR